MKISTGIYWGLALNGLVSLAMAVFVVICLIGFFGICAELYELGMHLWRGDDE